MNNSNISIEFIKRQAKQIKKERNITHTQALELLSKEYGYSNWKNCLRSLSKRTVEGTSTPYVKSTEPEYQRSLSFTDWLMKHRNRDSPLGDLATDMLRDKTWPLYNTLDKYRDYLHFRHADSGAVKALERAWKSYKAYLRRKNLSIPEYSPTMKEIFIKDKQKYLNDEYPFEDKPKLSDKVRCIHCGSIITVGDYKVFKIDWDEYICCPNAPECNGTIIDWMPLE